MDADAPPPPLRLAPGDPLAGLAPWLAEARVDAAAAGRARRRWLERQAAEDASVAGVLLDLAERGRPVGVHTRAGRVAHGAIAALGADFVIVREPRLGDVFVPFAHVAMIRTPPHEPATGDRRPGLSLVFGEALLELAASRPEVLVSVGTETVRGALRTVGTDIAAVDVPSQPRTTVHVALDAVDHLVVIAR